MLNTRIPPISNVDYCAFDRDIHKSRNLKAPFNMLAGGIRAPFHTHIVEMFVKLR